MIVVTKTPGVNIEAARGAQWSGRTPVTLVPEIESPLPLALLSTETIASRQAVNVGPSVRQCCRIAKRGDRCFNLGRIEMSRIYAHDGGAGIQRDLNVAGSFEVFECSRDAIYAAVTTHSLNMKGQIFHAAVCSIIKWGSVC